MHKRLPGKCCYSAVTASVAMAGLVCLLLAGTAAPAAGQTENLLDRVSNERMNKFEEQLTQNISDALSRYVAPGQYVLSVKVIWNKNIIPAVRSPGLTSQKQKLPGFPIFVTAPGAVGGDEATPPFVRMVVRVLLDETLPEYYERFIRKIVPIVARFDTVRGDQVIILKETFPVREDEGPPPTLPEEELMRQLGEESAQFLGPPQRRVMVPGMGEVGAPGMGGTPADGRGIPRSNPVEAAQIAYEEGRYVDALRIIQSAFKMATSNQERSMYLGMEGSIFYTMKNTPSAQASWQRALVFDPTNLDVQRVMHFLEQKKGRPPGPAAN